MTSQKRTIRVGSEADATSEKDTRAFSKGGRASAPAATGTPAGEPEAPVTPTAPAEGDQADGETPSENPEQPASPDPGTPGEPSRPQGDELGEEAIPSDPDAPASAAETPDEHERKLEQDVQELTVRAQKADEYLELAQRTKADFENYRKRAGREAAAAQERGIAKLARELLPAVDNLDRALQAAEASEEAASNGTATLVSGIKLVHQDVIAALARVGIEQYSPEGEVFDPQHHEAVAQQPVEGAAPGTIVEVYQRGYRLGGSVLRPARVVVAG